MFKTWEEITKEITAPVVDITNAAANQSNRRVQNRKIADSGKRRTRRMKKANNWAKAALRAAFCLGAKWTGDPLNRPKSTHERSQKRSQVRRAVVDKKGNLLRPGLPPDMQPGSGCDVGG